jgi:hypothetical protein
MEPAQAMATLIAFAPTASAVQSLNAFTSLQALLQALPPALPLLDVPPLMPIFQAPDLSVVLS